MASALQADDALGEEKHGENNADGEYNGNDNRKLIEILLHNAGSSTGVV